MLPAKIINKIDRHQFDEASTSTSPLSQIVISIISDICFIFIFVILDV